MLFGVGMKYLKKEEDARDAVQAVFLKALSEIPKYKVTYFKSWLYMIAKNHCLMQLRHHGMELPLDEDIAVPELGENPLEEKLAREQKLEDMEEALQLLHSEQQTCLRLFYLKKLSYQQVADQTGFSILQVKSHIQNGKRNLKILMLKKMQHE